MLLFAKTSKNIATKASFLTRPSLFSFLFLFLGTYIVLRLYTHRKRLFYAFVNGTVIAPVFFKQRKALCGQ